MQNIENILQFHISLAFKTLFAIEIESNQLKLTPTRKEFEGSHTFTCFQFAKQTGKAPDALGNVIGNYLKQNCSEISGFNVVKGFLNIVLTDQYFIHFLKSQAQKATFDFAPNGQKVMVEYSSPNTNKPLHLGHLRNNFLGFSMANILKSTGYEVVKANLINDRGIHICKSMLAYQKFGNNETPQTANLKGDKLVGKYYVEFDKQSKVAKSKLIENGVSEEDAEKQNPLLIEAQEMLLKWEKGDTEVVNLWKKMNSWVYDGFETTYKTIGVAFDKYYYESNTYLLGKEIVEEGIAKGVFYKKEDSSVWIDLTAEGLDHKLVLRSDGTSVYITQDMGTADLKYNEFGCNRSVYVVGNEQDYHFNVLFHILKKLNRPYANGLFHLSYGMVDLPSGKMKSREGTVVDADDLVQEMIDEAQKQTTELGKIDGFKPDEAQKLYYTLGLGALKYFLIKVDPKKRMLFNPAESIDFHGNTGPFIQYTHARVCAIMRKANELKIDYKNTQHIDLQATEREIIALLLECEKVVKQASDEYSPALIANYVYEIAKTYNSFYAAVSIFQEQNQEIVKFRVLLSETVAKYIKYCLNMLGIDAPERM
ncbi:MAG: arginine--tRNA ligase [Bacteroidetes bacterium]|nr:MAG: arginine--tRNA ligase [Bacteroidota bacterium]